MIAPSPHPPAGTSPRLARPAPDQREAPRWRGVGRPRSGRAVGTADATFLFDEWGASIADPRAALELQKTGQWQGNEVVGTNGVMAFLYFCSRISELAPQGHFDSRPEPGETAP